MLTPESSGMPAMSVLLTARSASLAVGDETPVEYQKQGATGRYARRRLLVFHASSSRRRAVAAQHERSHLTAASSAAASAATGHVPRFLIGPTYASHMATGRKQLRASSAVAILRQTFPGPLAQASARFP